MAMEVRWGGVDGSTMMTDNDDDGRVAPERRCLHLRMRMLWHDNDWRHSLPCIYAVGICGAL
jgi:hypothetical protein